MKTLTINEFLQFDLLSIREDLGFTQTEMAKRLGMCQSTYASIESGYAYRHKHISVNKMASILEVLGYSISICVEKRG